MDIREKLVELLESISGCVVEYCKDCEYSGKIESCIEFRKGWLADKLIDNGVMVQKHGRWLYSSIENPTFRVCDQCAASFAIGRNSGDDNDCPSCGAKMEVNDGQNESHR